MFELVRGTPREAWKTALWLLTWTALNLALKYQVMRIVPGFLSGVSPPESMRI